MKQLLFIFGFICLVATMKAQTPKWIYDNPALYRGTFIGTKGKTFYDVTYSAKDTLTANQTTHYTYFEWFLEEPATQSLVIHLDSLSAPRGTVTLSGSIFNLSSSDYTTIGSAITWNGTSADTTIKITNATANRYRYYRIAVARTAGRFLIYDAKMKVWKE